MDAPGKKNEVEMFQKCFKHGCKLSQDTYSVSANTMAWVAMVSQKKACG